MAWLERESASIIADISSALREACPVVKCRSRLKKDNFWTESLQELRKELRAAQKRTKSGLAAD